MTLEEKLDYIEKGFTEAQIEELDKGLTKGEPIDLYCRTDLMPQQMYQIRMGVEQGLDMSPYARPEYDWFQLEEIREGLLLGLSVEKYDSVDISSEKMHQMRRGLEDGMDLSDFLKYDADIIRELRKALLSKVDIITYVEQGYEAEQLYEIRLAAEEGLDVFNYLDIEYRAVALREIIDGLREGVDVEPYAKTFYSWSQMEQIRLGIISQVDISYYASPLYDRYQMEEIRKGLQAGLEVDEYTSLMYPASEMRRIRLELEETGKKADNSGHAPTPEELEAANRDGILINISDDDMTAFICVNPTAYGNITRKDILRSLRVLGVTQNIDARLVDDFLAGKHLGERLPIATGRSPIDGEDGYYEYFFETEKTRAPKVLPDGSVDFQNTQWYEQVKRGQKLAYYHSAGKGEPGSTVTGKKISSKRGKELPTLRCKGVVIQPDKKTYVADTDGRVELSGNKMEVSRIISLTDVNQATGNVEFEGNVLISGNVSNGVSIHAGGDVIIDGYVENCEIKAKGDVILRQGVNGGGTGVIEAGGSVEGKFFESVKVKAGKNISVNYCLNSNIYSEDTITIFGKKGLILGGTVFAARDIKAGNVGNEVGLKTIIRMGVSDAMKLEQRKVDSMLVDLENKLLVLNKGQQDFQDKYPAEIRNAMDMYIKIENAIYTLSLEKEEALERKERITKQIVNTAEAMLTVTGNLYENVLIEIDGKRVISTRAKNVTVKRVDNRVGIFQNVK